MYLHVLHNLLANVAFDVAENEPCKFCLVSVYIFTRCCRRWMPRTSKSVWRRTSMLLSAACRSETTSSASSAVSAARRSGTQAVRLQRDQICSHSSECLSAVITGVMRSLHTVLPFSPSKRRCTPEEGNEEGLEPLSSKSVHCHPLGAMQGKWTS